MAKIPLRAYIKEIENLIDRGEIEQAVAHARNILKSYPKHIETYRLLGKAYLESQRYSEAADILQRVLSVYPDDFMSQIGMSIIREDENNLDAAIWHMERAYEVQPFNPAVQDELRRLYGRRDGVEPPKIRLTRGALVRMYARGDLLPQAIAETRAALSEDPQRLDLQVLLARLYDQSNQKMEAAEVSSSILSKLPFCYEANRILSEVLPGTSRAEDAQKFQQRIYALDPYAAFLSPSAPSSDLVPDQAVTTERFVWDPAMTGEQSPDWARNVGVEWDETAQEDEVLPVWLGTLKPDETMPGVNQPAEEARFVAENEAAVAEAAASQEDLVPDWMKEAGWTPTDRSADEIMAEELAKDEAETAGVEDAELAPAELPDWLQSIAPPQSALAEEGDDQQRDEWLSTIFDEPGTGANGKLQAISLEDESAAAETEIPEWLEGQGPGADSAGRQETAASMSDSGELSGWEQEEPAPPGDVEVPEWLRAYNGETPAPTDVIEGDSGGVKSFETGEETGETAQDVPDWLKSFENGPAETGTLSSISASPAVEIPDWLETVQAAEEEPAGGTPDWLQSFEAEGDAGAAGEVEPLAGFGQGPSVGWLGEDGETPAEAFTVENLASEQAAPDAELPSVKKFDSSAVEAEQPQPDLENIDDAMAWLESLAAKQGADEATLITPPEERLDTPPDWIIQDMTAGEPPETVALSGTVEQAGTDGRFVIEPLSQTGPAADGPVEIPEWIQEFGEDEPAESAGLEAAAELSSGEQEDFQDWMQELAGNEVLPQIEPAASPAEIPDWMQELAGTEEIGETAAPAEIPDWMQKLSPDEPALAAGTETAAGVPDWISETLEETESPLSEEQPVDAVSSIAVETPAAEEAPDVSDFDSAMAWLESLAVKQGADEATLVTPPEQRLETPPEWIQKAAEEEPQAAAEYQPGENQTTSASLEIDYSAAYQADADDLLPAAEGTDTAASEPEVSAYRTSASLKETAPLPAQIDESPVVAELKAEEEKLPEWVKEMIALEPDSPAQEVETEADAVETVQAGEYASAEEIVAKAAAEPAAEVPQETTGAQAYSAPEMDDEDAFAWLESLAARQGAQEGTLITAPEERQDTPPEWVQEEAQSAQAEAIPDWLRSAEDVDAGGAVGAGAKAWFGETPVWDQEGAQVWSDESIPAGTAAEEIKDREALPAWLQQEALETPAAAETGPELVPDWLQNLEEEEKQSQPYSFEMEASSEAEFQTSWSQEVEYEQGQSQAGALEIEPAAGLQEFAGETASVPTSLGQAQSAMRAGQIDNALVHYQRFIENGEYLKETIQDLRDALYRYPVDIDIWQLLGDAYARNDQLQDALDAYTKAEEFLR